MAKAPRLGRVKTRLARDIGRGPATRFYRRQAALLLHRLSAGPWRRVLALAPGAAIPAIARIWPQSRHWRVCLQPPGPLGQRMLRLMIRQPPGPVVLVGSDIPDIRPAPIRAAFRALGQHDVVFGPALDGGYWLIGIAAGTKRKINPHSLDRVRWSSPDALQDSVEALQGKAIAVAVLPIPLSDIDDGADYWRWCTANGAPGGKAP